MAGYVGPRGLLEIDLHRADRAAQRTPRSIFADTLGGVGLAVRLMMSACAGRWIRSGPSNPIVFAAGPVRIDARTGRQQTRAGDDLGR